MGAATTAPSVPPLRPDAARATLRRERRWLPTVVVALVIVVVVSGGYVVAGALSTPAGSPRTVGGAVTVAPLSDWRFVGTLDSHLGPGIRFTRGSGNLDVLAGTSSGDAGAVADAYVAQVLQPQATRLSVSPDLQSVTLPGGVAGVRFSYIGIFRAAGVAPIEGEVTVAVLPSGAGVVFDGWAPQGLLAFVLGDVHAMIEEARFP